MGIFFAFSQYHDMVKVGRTINPESMLNNLRRREPEDELFMIYFDDVPQLEEKLHMFIMGRGSSDWFKGGPELFRKLQWMYDCYNGKGINVPRKKVIVARIVTKEEFEKSFDLDI